MEIVSDTEESGTKLDKFDPLTCKPESLRGHIVNEQLTPGILAHEGVPLWDIELCELRSIPLDWVLKKAYQRIEERDDEITKRIRYDAGIYEYFCESNGVYIRRGLNFLDPDAHRVYVIRTLICIEQHGYEVNWARVEMAFPGARVIDFDPGIDSKGGPFDLQTDYFKNPYPKLI